ncbi:hypothetical protein DR864_16180 [Runella rosea]|uniref:Lipoprotein n=1 Tax=Runella rosea TaxID=2259595 RepID=A0A344TKL0_9BACT|nr:hypothetical protein [Runella rosea]AXE19181.1 hypothetical protein DR864_16180 [Runella rosea]
MKRLLKPLLYAAAALLMSVSCKKEQTPIDRFALRPELDCESSNGNCCRTTPGIRYEFITELKDELISISAISDSIFPYLWGSGIKINGKTLGGFLCELGLEKLKGLSATPITKAQIRVSGKVYLNKGQTTYSLNTSYLYELSIEKAELVR